MSEKNHQFNFNIIIKGFLDAFNIERGIIPTLRDLLIRPAKVINYYIEGKRVKYFSPGRFFVTIIAILSIITFFFGSFNEDAYKNLMMEVVEGQIGKERLYNETGKFIFESVFVTMTFILNTPWFRFPLLIIPSAFASWLIFYKYRYNLSMHFVVHIYCWCFIALLLGIISSFVDIQEYSNYVIRKQLNLVDEKNIDEKLIWQYEWINWTSNIFPFFYFSFSLKQIFKLNWISSILKSIFFLLLSYLFLISLGFGLMLCYIYFQLS